MRSVLVLCAAFACGVSCHAQATAAITQGPDGDTRTFTPGISVPPYAGAPFSATDTIVRVRPLPNGGTVTSYIAAKVMRDSQGRLYRESHHFSTPDEDPRKSLYAFYIADPVAHTRTDCTVATHHCVMVRYFPRTNHRLQPAGPFDNGRRVLIREALGPETIEDLQTTGTRETINIAQGVVGNDQVLTLTRELWYSPDLKGNLRVVRSDPREGTDTIRLKGITRGDPDPASFAVPAGYTVQGLAPAASTSPAK